MTFCFFDFIILLSRAKFIVDLLLHIDNFHAYVYISCTNNMEHYSSNFHFIYNHDQNSDIGDYSSPTDASFTWKTFSSLIFVEWLIRALFACKEPINWPKFKWYQFFGFLNYNNMIKHWGYALKYLFKYCSICNLIFINLILIGYWHSSIKKILTISHCFILKSWILT